MIDWHDNPMKFSFALFNLVNIFNPRQQIVQASSIKLL